MKHLPLVWAGLWRKPSRTIFTMVCIAIAFLLFGLLQGVDSAFSLVVQQQKLDRLFVDPRVPGQPLPISYRAQIERIPGVTRITEVAFLPGYYQDSKNGMLAVTTNPAQWLAIRPEWGFQKQQVEAVARTRTGALISSWLAENNHWKIGDRFMLHSPLPTKDGKQDWPFDVVGILTPPPDATGPVRLFLANFKYYDEAHFGAAGTVSRYLLRIDDARHAGRVSRQIDALFASSGAPTRTQSEQEMTQSELASLGDINFFTHAVMAAVFFTLLILTVNTMIESVRERTSELAVLMTLGFPHYAVLALVVAEAFLLCLVTSLVGLALAAAAFPLAREFVGTAVLPFEVILIGAACAVGVALISALLPGWRAMRLSIIDALAVR